MRQRQYDHDNITIRCAEDVKTQFMQLSQKHDIARSELFAKMIENFKDTERRNNAFFDLQSAHDKLHRSCAEIETQMFDMFVEYAKSLEKIREEAGEIGSVIAENKKLYQLVLDQQEMLHAKDDEIKEQKNIIDYLTKEIEQQKVSSK